MTKTTKHLAWGEALDKLIEIVHDGTKVFTWVLMILFFLPAIVIFLPIGAGVKLLKWIKR